MSTTTSGQQKIVDRLNRYNFRIKDIFEVSYFVPKVEFPPILSSSSALKSIFPVGSHTLQFRSNFFEGFVHLPKVKQNENSDLKFNVQVRERIIDGV